MIAAVRPARTMIGVAPTARLPAGADRVRLIHRARLYAAAARRWGFGQVAGICEVAASALEALDDAEHRLALLAAESFNVQTVPISVEQLRQVRSTSTR